MHIMIIIFMQNICSDIYYIISLFCGSILIKYPLHKRFLMVAFSTGKFITKAKWYSYVIINIPIQSTPTSSECLQL